MMQYIKYVKNYDYIYYLHIKYYHNLSSTCLNIFLEYIKFPVGS